MPPGHQPWPRLRNQICHQTVQQTPPLTIDNFMLTASAANSVVVSVNSRAAGDVVVEFLEEHLASPVLTSSWRHVSEPDSEALPLRPGPEGWRQRCFDTCVAVLARCDRQLSTRPGLWMLRAVRGREFRIQAEWSLPPHVRPSSWSNRCSVSAAGPPIRGMDEQCLC